MKIHFQKIIFLGLLSFMAPSLVNAQSADVSNCLGAVVNGVCNANISVSVCANGSTFEQPDGTITCQVPINGQWVVASFNEKVGTIRTPIVTSSPDCAGPVVNGVCRTEIANAQNNCIAGTIQTDASGNRSCQVLLNGQYTTTNICTGTETTGPCRAERINLQAALEAARQMSLATGRQCRAEFSSFPTIDINTGLSNGFYQTLCEGDFGFNPTDYANGIGPVRPTTPSQGTRPTNIPESTRPENTGGMTTINVGASTNSAYISGLMEIINRFLENARRLYGTR